MIVEKIEPINTKRRKISLDNGLVFALYNGEIHRFKIEEGKELLEDSYYEILQTILIKRAKERLAYLIKDGDYTEFQIQKKLKQGFYPEEAIEEALQFGRDYHYLDDWRYAQTFAEQKAGTMSRKLILMKLLEKGISKDMADRALSCLEDKEDSALERLIRKKNIDFSTITWKEKQKICAYFMRKGFTYENILKKINEISGTDYLT